MKTIYILFLSLILFSCKSQTDGKKINHSHTHHHHQAKTNFKGYPKIEGEEVFNNYHSHSNTHQKLKIELLNGSKFISDTNSFLGMNNIKILLDSFNISNSSLIKYKDLGYNCKKEAVYILNNSKMEGEGYTVFHDLMHTLVFDIKNLDLSIDMIQAQKNLAYIQEDINSFFNYFENLDFLTEN
jgi:hypothetical protein